MDIDKLYIFAQIPPVQDGTICPVEADSVEQAIQNAEQVLAVTLRSLGGGNFTDGTKNYFLYFGNRGFEQFMETFELANLPIPATNAGSRQLFRLGEVRATPGAIAAMQEAGHMPLEFVCRHQCGDWQTMDRADRLANQDALKTGGRIFSAYKMKNGVRLWVITEAVGDDDKRESTTLILPDEY